MSRDLTPMELDYVQKTNNMPNIADSLVNADGSYVYTEEQREMSHRCTRLGMFGFDFLVCCKEDGILNSDTGKELIQQIEDYFNGAEIEKELAETTQKWYEGQLEPGYHMYRNDEAFVEYIRLKINNQLKE